MFPFPTFTGGFVLAAGDFNGDGRRDVAAAGTGAGPASSAVSVLLGRDDGTFDPPRPLETGVLWFRSTAIVVGDFNGDGLQDLAVANAYTFSSLLPCPPCPSVSDGNVSILLGHGDGTFGQPKHFAVGKAPASIATGDFNEDGRQDLVVANSLGGDLSILPGLGDGTFAPQVRLAVVGPVVVGDFNSDGHLDLAAANAVSGDVSVLLGRGDGTFGPAAHFAAGPDPNSLTVGDFNGDGRQDLVITTGSPSSIDLFILLGHGDGTFATPVGYAAGERPRAVAVADFNDDGRQDLAVAGAGEISVLLARADGTFGLPTSYGGFDAGSIVPGHFNRDGRLDLALNSGYGVLVLLGRGDGRFMIPSRYKLAAHPISATIGDFNGDRRLDLAVPNLCGWYDPLNPCPDVSILLGRDDGTFEPEIRLTVGRLPTALVVGDFNGDGRQDLVVSELGSEINTSDVFIVLGRGDGSFGPEARYAVGVGPESIAVGDFNGDGRQDLAVANRYDSASHGVSVLLGRGNGTFAPQTFYEALAGFIAIGDFNGDDRQDLAVADLSASTVSVLTGRGDGTFDPPVTFMVGGFITSGLSVGAGNVNSSSLVVADFDGDGHQDLAVTTSRGVSVLLGHGDGTFGTPASYGIDAPPVSIAVGDLNGDARQDLAVATYPIGVSILLGRGDGTFDAPLGFLTGVEPASLAVGNFNGDRRADIAVANTGSQDVWILLNQGQFPVGAGGQAR